MGFASRKSFTFMYYAAQFTILPVFLLLARVMRFFQYRFFACKCTMSAAIAAPIESGYTESEYSR